ncbi:unnamed protein product [Urochloa humidicola]
MTVKSRSTAEELCKLSEEHDAKVDELRSSTATLIQQPASRCRRDRESGCCRGSLHRRSVKLSGTLAAAHRRVLPSPWPVGGRAWGDRRNFIRGIEGRMVVGESCHGCSFQRLWGAQREEEQGKTCCAYGL